MKFLASLVKWIVRGTAGAFGTLLRAFLLTALIASLAFNVAMFTVSGFYAAASSVLSNVGIRTILASETGENLAKRKATRKISRETSKKVTRRVQRGAARNISSVAGEAIPIVGVAVIAGALTLEVKDACDTAADMAGLEAAFDAEGDPEAARAEAIATFDCLAMIREELPQYDDMPSKDEIWASMKAAPSDAYQAAMDAGISLAEYDWAGGVSSTFETTKGMVSGWFGGTTDAEEGKP